MNNIHGIEICVWREIALHDEKNHKKGLKGTLEPDCECFNCCGYNKECKNYLPNEWKRECEIK